jgi:hypothetical protein
LPWSLYWTGLHNVEGRPSPSVNSLTPSDSSDLQWYLRTNAPLLVEPLSPWSYFPSLILAHPRPMPGADVAWIIARHYNTTHLQDRHMIWWHISGAALTIWLTRNWTGEQVLATAAEIARARAASSAGKGVDVVGAFGDGVVADSWRAAWVIAAQKLIQRLEPRDVRKRLRVGGVAEDHGHL